MRVLVFDIWGDYGHFRKFYTTTSPLTFSIPPPSTIAGILGAIYGVAKDEYLKVFSLSECYLAVKIVNPIKKVRIGLNLAETKGTNLKVPFSDRSLAFRTQIRTEFLKDPYFRIYFAHKNENILEEISQIVEEHKCVYTISLGLSELLANYKYVGFYNTQKIFNCQVIEISTAIAASNLCVNGIEIERSGKYFKEKMPLIMNPDRVIEKYDDVIFEPEGKTIKARLNNYFKLENGENITFF